MTTISSVRVFLAIKYQFSNTVNHVCFEKLNAEKLRICAKIQSIVRPHISTDNLTLIDKRNFPLKEFSTKNLKYLSSNLIIREKVVNKAVNNLIRCVLKLFCLKMYLKFVTKDHSCL